MSDEILIRVKAISDGYHDYDYSLSLTNEVVTFDKLLEEQSDYLINNRGYIKVKDKIDQKSAKLLRSHGWIHKGTAISREEKKVVKEEYYLADQKDYYAKFSKIDIDNLTDDQILQLAKHDAKIVQVVDMKSVLSSSQYKKVLAEKNKMEERKQRAKLLEENKKIKRKQKEIDAAKKLLEEAGELK